MKKILLSILSLTVTSVIAVGATRALFTDTEKSSGDVLGAASLDLHVDGQDGDVGVKFSASDMVPGETKNGGCIELSNSGSVDGKLSVVVTNIASHENELLEPEVADGDEDGVEKDFNSYDGNTGDGELWDELVTNFWIEAGAGSHSTNGTWDWDDKSVYNNFGTPGNDTSSTYSLHPDEDLASTDNVVIPAGTSKTFCMAARIVDKPGDGWDWGHWGALTNNMVMTDDATFDLVFGLSQITP